MRATFPVIDPCEVEMSPAKVIQRFENLLSRDGAKSALSERVFQKEREAWVGAVFALIYSTLTHQEYFIKQVKEKDEPPDLILYSYRNPETPDEKGVVREQMLTEIMEYPASAKSNLTDHIMEKLNDKYYHPETRLICYIQRPGESTKLIDVIHKLRDSSPRIKEIWLLFNVWGEIEGNYHLARVFSTEYRSDKDAIVLKGNYIELAKVPQREMINPTRGGGKTVTFTPGRQVIVPLPKRRSH